MKLPFSKASPFPASAFTPTPSSLKMGVEAQAKAAMPAVNPALTTVASDRVAALGRNPAIPPAPAPAAQSAPIMTAAAEAPRLMMMAPAPSAAVNPLGGMSPQSPLGGMDARGIAQRGGPMSYAPKGVGTNNPNAYAVGRNNKNFDQRTGQTPAMAPIMQMSPAAPAPMMLGGSAPNTSPAPVIPGRDDAFWASMDNTAFIAEQDALRTADAATEAQAAADKEAQAQKAAAKTIVGGEQLAMQGGFVPMVRKGDGSMSMAGGFIPTPKAEAPLPEGMVPTRAMRGGVQYEPAQAAGTGKAPSFTYEKDPSGKITGAVYPVQDPQTGQWKLQRADLNGDGVISPQEAAAVPAGAAAAPSGAKKTKVGNSYSF